MHPPKAHAHGPAIALAARSLSDALLRLAETHPASQVPALKAHGVIMNADFFMMHSPEPHTAPDWPALARSPVGPH